MDVAYRQANRRVDGALQFLKTSINPMFYNAAPPVDSDSRSDILKDVTIQCQFTIPNTTPISEGIGYTTGMILWLLKRPGLGSIYRMAFVPTGAVSYSSDPSVPGNNGLNSALLNTTRTIQNPPPTGPTWTSTFDTDYLFGVVDPQGVLATLTYNQELAIPLGVQNGNSNIIQVSRSITDQISFSRVFAGFVEAYSSSISIGNTALAGTWTAASISDTRYVSQSATGAFSITNLMQSSETTKDAVMQVLSDQGVAVIVGPDIQDKFTNPNQDMQIIDDGTYTLYSLSTGQYAIADPAYQIQSIAPPRNPGPPYGTNAPQPSSAPLMNFWVSPWNTTVTTNTLADSSAQAFPTLSAAVTNIQTYRISETGIPKYRIWGDFYGDLYGLAQVGPLETCEVGFAATHVFATANLSGSIQYNTFIEKKGVVVSGYTFTVGQNRTALDYNPQLFFTSFTQTGKYIGTFFTGFMVPVSGYPSWIGTDGTNIWWYMTLHITNLELAVINNDSNVGGEHGPARIIRWDNMSLGSQLDVAGKLWAQIIPSSELSPYVKASQMNRTRYVPENAERFVKRIYDGAGTPFRRVWNLKTYKQFVRIAANDVNIKDVIGWARNDDGIEEDAYELGVYGVPAIAGGPTDSGTRRGREDGY